MAFKAAIRAGALTSVGKGKGRGSIAAAESHAKREDPVAKRRSVRASPPVAWSKAEAMPSFLGSGPLDYVAAFAAHKRETGAAVLLIHHSGKHGGSERGSSALRGAADVMAELTRDKGDGPIKLACTKSKDAEPFVSRHFRLKVVETPSGGTSCAVVAAEPGKGGKPNLTENERTVLELMTQRSSSNEGVTRKDIIELGGIPEGSVQHVLPSLVRRGFVQQEKKRAPYYITNEGLAAVNSEKAETEYHSEP